MVDAADYARVVVYHWYRNGSGYALASYDGSGRRPVKPVMMHRLIADPPAGMVVDHVDGDRLNNTRGNLRVCTARQNLQRMRSTRGSSRYKGVHRRSDAVHRPWQARIVVEGRRVSLGFFATEADAARAYDGAAVRYFGAFARTNADGGGAHDLL